MIRFGTYEAPAARADVAPAPAYRRDQALTDLAARGLTVAPERLDSDPYIEAYWRGTLSCPVVNACDERVDAAPNVRADVEHADEERSAADLMRRETAIEHLPAGEERERAGRAWDRRQRAISDPAGRPTRGAR